MFQLNSILAILALGRKGDVGALLDGSASDWKKHFQPIRSTSQMWVVTRHRYEIPALVPPPSLRGKTTWNRLRCCRMSAVSQPSIMKTKLNLPCHHFGVRCITDFIFFSTRYKSTGDPWRRFGVRRVKSGRDDWANEVKWKHCDENAEQTYSPFI